MRLQLQKQNLQKGVQKFHNKKKKEIMTTRCPSTLIIKWYAYNNNNKIWVITMWINNYIISPHH